MTAPIPSNAPVRTQRPMGTRLLPLWLILAGAVACAGVSIDLFRGAPVSAFTSHAAQIQASSIAPLDHSVLARLTDEQPLAPGASIAAYDTSASEVASLATAAPLLPRMADDALEPGASIAAYPG